MRKKSPTVGYFLLAVLLIGVVLLFVADGDGRGAGLLSQRSGGLLGPKSGLTRDGTNISTIEASDSFGIGTSSPRSKFTVTEGANSTTTIDVGDYAGTGAASCINMLATDGSAVSLYVVGTTLNVEAGRCN